MVKSRKGVKHKDLMEFLINRENKGKAIHSSHKENRREADVIKRKEDQLFIATRSEGEKPRIPPQMKNDIKTIEEEERRQEVEAREKEGRTESYIREILAIRHRGEEASQSRIDVKDYINYNSTRISKNEPLIEDMNEEARVEKISFKKPRRAREGDRGFLLGSYYDGEKHSIYLKLYLPDKDEIVVFYDPTNYKPYFLTDLEPDKIHSTRSIVSHPGFEGIEVVRKKDVLRNRDVKVTKIIVKTPDVVPILRNKVPRAWEAHIKFHHNYIYDQGLIPGLLYRVSNGRIEVDKLSIDEKTIERVMKAFEEDDEDTKKMALEWLPLFESEPPKPRRVAVDIEVYTPFKGRIPDASEASYPVISIALASTDGHRKVLVLYREGLTLGNKIEFLKKSNVTVEIFDSEKTMIIEALRQLSEYPIVLSFNGDNFDLPYLYNRALKLGVKKEEIPLRFTRNSVQLEYGLHIDLYKFFSIKAIQTYAFSNSYKEFTLDAIAGALLGESKVVLDKNISDLSLTELIEYNLRDAELTLKLTTFDNDLVWTLIILLMRISKLPLEDLTRSQISSWIKSLFYWEHRKRNYIIPTQEEIIKLKGTAKSDAIIKGKKYQGALVLDPPSGIYFNIVVLDFASLYPTIIKRWNLSYETVNPIDCPNGKIAKVPDVGHTVCMGLKGISAQIVGLLRDYRVKIYKKKAKDRTLPQELRTWYDTVQAALKVYINASYGVFGASSFPLYSPPVAESVTAIGRHAIKLTLRKAAELGLRVLYGDTDSLFLWNPSEEALKELIKYVEESFGLELEIDKIYRFVTFSGLKKNYIGVYPEGGLDIKGLVAKKRNTPEFLKKEFSEILKLISGITNAEDFLKLREKIKVKIHEIYDRLKNLEYNLDELAIKVALNKPINAYVKSTPQHVKAAKQLVNAGVEVFPGDIISFIKTKSTEGVRPIQLARLVEVDVDKYIEYLRTTFEQILGTLNINWDDIVGSKRLELFLRIGRR